VVHRRAHQFLVGVMGAVVVMVALAWGCGGNSGPAPSPTSSTTAVAPPLQPQCNSSLWAHVYQPTRLKIMASCQTVTGTIVKQHTSDDGDFDIEVALDPQFANLLNKANISNLNGTLNVEAICQGPVQPDASVAAPGCTDVAKITVPPVGTHVQVTGSYVLDTNHGWMEIHPITSITPQ
jgi:hypothetical protein